MNSHFLQAVFAEETPYPFEYGVSNEFCSCHHGGLHNKYILWFKHASLDSTCISPPLWKGQIDALELKTSCLPPALKLYVLEMMSDSDWHQVSGAILHTKLVWYSPHFGLGVPLQLQQYLLNYSIWCCPIVTTDIMGYFYKSKSFPCLMVTIFLLTCQRDLGGVEVLEHLLSAMLWDYLGCKQLHEQKSQYSCSLLLSWKLLLFWWCLKTGDGVFEVAD